MQNQNIIYSLFPKKTTFILSQHCLMRFDERVGETYWQGKKIKYMSAVEKRNLIKNEIKRYTKEFILDGLGNIKIITSIFTIILGVNEKSFLIKTIYKSKPWYKSSFKVEELLNKEQKNYLIKIQKAIRPDRDLELTAS